MYATENLICIKTGRGNFLASRDHLLIISDLASQRYLLRLLSIGEKFKPRADFPTLDILNKLLETLS